MTYHPQSRSIASIHAEWLSLLDSSGPFLSVDVLTSTDGFRQGLPQSSDSADRRRDLSNYYEQWLTSTSHRKPDNGIERAWFRVVIEDVLEWGSFALDGQAIPPGLTHTDPGTHESVGPDVVFRDDDGKVRLLVQRYPAAQSLNEDVPGSRWLASPAARLVTLLQHTGVRLGMVTNGAQWLLVNASSGEQPGFATWFTNLWFEELATLDAFRALLGVERFVGVPTDQSLEAMLQRSAEELAGVTTTLGYQVRQAIELLVEGIDREDADRNGALLEGVPDEQVYEASISVMMRLVFLLFAEDQQPPLIGGNNLAYEQHYAVSNLIQSLEEVEEEVLEQRRDAWPRLLATFRLVHAGSDHDQMRQPAYGGSLFDPDRFPFLEGREPRTSWSETAAQPLPINNRTVLHMLQAIQFLELKRNQGRQRISFRALDVEQIGHVYEQLLEHTARRASGHVLGLAGSMNKGVRNEPEVELADLEAWHAQGDSTLLKHFKDLTGRSEAALKNLLATEPDLLTLPALRTALGSEEVLQRALPFTALVRTNRAGRPTIIRPGGLYVTSGSDRSSTGAHYTPRSLTEPIVQYTLEPLVYDGPADGKPREEWKLHPPKALLSLNICDPAMGSGAFLVQACRWLAERLVESWNQVAREFETVDSHGGEPLRIVPDGSLSRGNPTDELLPADQTERLAIARRLVADHCLYGVDVNPLAVDMAKLSLWLVTLQANRPFTFLDHRLRCGDSLLGSANLDHLRHWSLAGQPDSRSYAQTSWFNQQVRGAIERGIEFHRRIEDTPVADVHDIERQAALHRQAEQVMDVISLGADLLVGSALVDDKKRRDPVRKDLQVRYSVQMDALQGISKLTPEAQKPVFAGLQSLREKADNLLGRKRPFHWPLEFPEIFVDSSTHNAPGGFSAIVGNPPFLGGKKITGALGVPFRDYLVEFIGNGVKGNADLCAYFLLRVGQLVHRNGQMGVLATNTIAQGDTREVGLDQLAAAGFSVLQAIQSEKWPGAAALEVAHLWLRNGGWNGGHTLDHQPVQGITPYLTPPGRAAGTPHRLAANASKSFIGSLVLGTGFVLEPEEALVMIERDPRNRDVLFPYLNGEDLNSRPDQSPSRWVINFRDWPLERAMGYAEPFQIVLERVKPERDKLGLKADATAKGYARLWWQYGRKGLDLYRTIAGLDRVLVRAQVSKTHAMVFFEPGIVFSMMVIPIALSGWSDFAALQSSFHERWTNQHASSLKGDQRYTPTDCFENFTRPVTTSETTQAGQRYYHARQAILTDRQIALTPLYNAFNDPGHLAQDLRQLRELHRELDCTVSAAYGWDDLDLEHGFHETKQGERFTISDAARREVLDRLLELNHQRYAEEVTQGLHEKGARGKAKWKSAAQKSLL